MILSVCMATYNGEKYIREQLDSIIIQLGPNDEILIQDDGSSDSTIDIIQSYKDDRIKLQINKVNMGVIPTFENCISRAKGDIIFLSDQDDVWRTDKVKVVVDKFSDRNVMAVVSDATVIDQTGTTLHNSYFRLGNSGPGVFKNFLKNSYLGCCLTFRKELIPIIKPIPMTVRTHDGWIGIVANLSGKVIFIQETLIYYRRHGNNLSQMHRFPLYDVVYRRFALLYNIVRVARKTVYLKKFNNSRENTNGET